MSVTAFAKHIGVSRVMLSRVLNQRAGFTAEMSIKISRGLRPAFRRYLVPDANRLRLLASLPSQAQKSQPH